METDELDEVEILFIAETELPCCKQQDPIECGSLDAWLQLREQMHELETWYAVCFHEVFECPSCEHVHQIDEWTHSCVRTFIHFDFTETRWSFAQIAVAALCNECHENVGYLDA